MESQSERTRAERLFLLSSYVTLTVACACLVWSEIGILNEIIVFAVVVAGLIIASYFMEGRWSMSARSANRLGVVIGLFALFSVARQMIYPPTEGPLTLMPWPTSMVPLLGPLLLVLLSVKLMRPKSIGDHWWLQVIGLVCVSLGCTLADDGVFATLMAIYLVLSLWCLTLFFLYRERLTHPGSRPATPPRGRQIAVWSIPILLFGAAGFLTIPRSHAIWNVPQNLGKMESGAPEEPGIDLHREGTLTLNPDVAFEVYAEDHYGRPKLDISPNQRWRGPVYRVYRDGNWRLGPLRQDPGQFGRNQEDASGVFQQFDRPDRYFLNFTIREKMGRIPFISDPIYYEKDEIPVVTVNSEHRFGSWQAVNESMLMPFRQSPLAEGDKYRQVCAPPPAPDLHDVHPTRFNRAKVIGSPNLPELTEWTQDLIGKLGKSNSILAAAVANRNESGEIRAENYEIIARALCDYLSSSGEYRYDLVLETKNKKIDPTLDFLVNTKSGHCNRFASALALMLRTMQIPCQVVTGFRGADSVGDGNYIVRQCYAHTWVEVYIPHRTAPASPVASASPLKWYWLTLDPTPPEAEADAAATTHWWDTGLSLRRIYRNLILNFSYDNRNDFFRDVSTAGKAIWGGVKHEIAVGSILGFVFLFVFAVVAVVAGLLIVRLTRAVLRRWRNWRGRTRLSTQTEFYRRMLAILTRRGWRKSPSQTASEFADAISQRLRSRQYDETLTEIVRQTAALFDRVRFGDRPLEAQEANDVRAGLDRLAVALAKR